MTEAPETTTDAAEVQARAEKLAALAERSQHAVQAFWERQARQATGVEFALVDFRGIARAYQEFGALLLSDPAKLVEAQTALWKSGLALWNTMMKRMQGEAAEPVVVADPHDRRFKDKAWSEQLFFDYLKQSYLLTAEWMNALVAGAEGLDPKTREKVTFYTRQFVSAMAPSNFALTNPQVLGRIEKTGGQNLVDGLEHMIEDLERGQGRLRISMTDEAAFEVGRNLAISPGKVVFQNDLMQLIQYAPTTETAFRRPLLIVPHWINKYYVLDLQPRNSLVKWAVDRGHTVFLISWVNPRRELAHKTLEDYMAEGPLAALDAIQRATGAEEINALGFCIGGILLTATLAYLGAVGDRRVRSATFLATLTDLQDVGEAAVFIDDDQLRNMERHLAEKGYLDGHHLADMFSMMRENDLIWSFVVNNYLMGREPMAFDLLYWNADSTRLPGAMLIDYLRRVYMENALAKPGAMTLAGVPIDIREIRIPCYALATKEDHIAPWKSCYPLARMVSGKARFVLGASGHIAGIVNPPGQNKYGFWTGATTPGDPEAWLAAATFHEGSWWPDWSKWLARRGGGRIPAPKPGAGGLPAIEDAPGSYVMERAAD